MGVKMKIKICGDTTNDLTPEQLKKHNISLKPIIINLGDDEYRDDNSLDPETIFGFVDKTGQMPKTAAINPLEFEEFFSEQLKSDDGYDALIYFSLSSGISSLCQNAQTAAQKFDGKVFVIDSKTLSTGIGVQMLYACELRKQGLTAKEIVEKVEARKQFAQTSFVIDTLKYLYKGGRCSVLALFGANLLRIHPEIVLKDGKMTVGKKFRGKYKDVVKDYVKTVLQQYPNPDRKICFITHTPISSEIVDMVREQLEASGKFDHIVESNASCTIGCHCGRNTIGVLFYSDGENATK